MTFWQKLLLIGFNPFEDDTASTIQNIVYWQSNKDKIKQLGSFREPVTRKIN